MTALMSLAFARTAQTPREVLVTDLINLMNDLLWGSILVYLLVGVGVYFTVRLGFIQFRHFGTCSRC